LLTNSQRLNAAVAIALSDTKFMGDNTKVDKAIVALTPKSTVSGTFKRLQGNALEDYLVKKDAGFDGYSDSTRAEKIKKYVADRFQTYLDDPKTSDEAKKLFNATYPVVNVMPLDTVPSGGVTDDAAPVA
jgi:hypothetical protein